MGARSGRRADLRVHASAVAVIDELTNGVRTIRQSVIPSIRQLRLAPRRRPHVASERLQKGDCRGVLDRRDAVQHLVRHRRPVVFAVGVRIGDVLVVTTHLDDVQDAESGAIRQEQVRTIFREWDGEQVAIIAGDMNAEPGDLEMGLFSEAGYSDLAEPAGPTTTMDDSPKRIDYIWGIGVIGSSPHTVMALGASDHRAVVVNVSKSSR